MKTLIRIFAPLAVLGALASCQMYKIDTQMTPEKLAASLRMECSATDVYTLASQDPDAISFNVSANTPWTITPSSGADWLEVSPASSASSALISDVTVVAQSNNSLQDRSATLILRGENISKTKIITIKQLRMGRLFVTPMVGDYSAAGGPLSFTIQTNQAWEVRSSEGWLTFNRENGEPDPEGRTITIIATADPSNVLERTATVTVTAGDDEESFDVLQHGTFLVTELSEPFDGNGGEQTFSIKTDLPWEINADQTWLTFDKTSGTGDGSVTTITATAAANEGALRTANVTVSAGGVDKSFVVSQKGFTFEIVTPASTELPRLGGEMVLAVNTALAWEPSTDVPGWSVEKIDASSFKVKADFNNIFIPKTGVVKITAAGVVDELELTQDINFVMKGHTELLEDGSLKVYEDEKSGIATIDNFQYVIMDAEVEMHLGDKGSFLMGTQHYSDGYEYQLYIDLNRSDKYRLRSNGGKVTTRGSKEFTFDKTKLDAMTHAQIQFIPDAEDPTSISQTFYCNGEIQDKVLVSTSVFAAEPTLEGNYEVVSIVTADDGSYFIIKSCTVTPVE